MCIRDRSYDEFSVAGENIRFGLAAVKGVGRSFMKQLVEEREANGLFTSFQDFCERMYDRELNRRALESLIKAGDVYKRQTLAFGLAVVGVLLWMVLPQLVTSITSLVDSMDLYMNEISGWVASLLHNNPEIEHRCV